MKGDILDVITTCTNCSKKGFRTRSLVCPNCAGETRHKTLARTVVFYALDRPTSRDDVPPWVHSGEDSLEIVQCAGCETVSFYRDRLTVHSWNQDGDPVEGTTVKSLYPPRVAGLGLIKETHLLPLEVCRLYNETQAALCNELPILTGAGIRAIIEAVCKEKGAEGKNHEERIGELENRRIVTPSEAKLLQRLRLLGNEALHNVKVHDERELCRAFEVINHMLNGVYVIPRLGDGGAAES